MSNVNFRYSGIWKELLKHIAPYHFRVMRAGHFLACCANQVEQITRCLERHTTVCATSSITPTAEISSVGITGKRFPPARYSLLRLSLPEINGVPKPMAAS